ncbi:MULTISPECIES: aspartate kinase [Mesonia]|uniref:Lysine-sensitive aspartokinase 3 n=1 Tax=Mesonia oceanica TaxID=2687242 RepID=A0AC61YC68_9FLAO|nr:MULTISPECIES: aspartate kinase [Mesonia]MAN28394.1 aspartate kinase [Mesonia sp.]MAQ40184.1 aspartate kinase [Mesonia sp.]MBJ98889.1 aspartate kinase [Flavobacteriaceae bacterium]VVV01875.1 Lysine-sensitive aspartokinase 3 [Mesonia oceanica]|tara:strand:+ start:73300 stop:74553 length:1254 start_codon:yes stop_codon:yes gene_type:complete
MNIFKFGGASVKDAQGVKNVAKVLQKTGITHKVVVISAMGKTTNALEKVIHSYFEEDTSLTENIQVIKTYHHQILMELFPDKSLPVFHKVKHLFEELETFLNRNKSPNYDYVYDQVIGFGELISTTIVSEYLSFLNIENTWLDARNLIKTDATYRDAKVNWVSTEKKIQENIQGNKLYLTQGFIASDPNNFTTTLGREGSDYTAGIFAYCLKAIDVTIWKDVDGVLNADPRVFKNTQLLKEISYEEAIELAFYGASVIHPKTLQPLQKREIPLLVKSFYHPEAEGTVVGRGKIITPYVPCFIVKKNLVLLSLSALDFSFFVEENISEIFALFHKYQIKVDLIQNSAISFSVCVDNKFNNVDKLITHLKAKYKVKYHKNVSLYTIRHFSEEAINQLEEGKTILLKQLTRTTVQLVTKE